MIDGLAEIRNPKNKKLNRHRKMRQSGCRCRLAFFTPEIAGALNPVNFNQNMATVVAAYWLGATETTLIICLDGTRPWTLP